jgi:rhodanese-related sulfurtransferase
MAKEIGFVSVEEVMAKREADPELLLLDVRTEEEWEMHHIPGATLIPMHTLLQRLSELDPTRETIVICEHGVRSENVANYLAQQVDFVHVATMVGGMSVWTGPKEYGA